MNFQSAQNLVAASQTPPAGKVALLLVEITTLADRANTDPHMDYAVRVDTPPNRTPPDQRKMLLNAQLPRPTRALVDLVASDNNLGLLVNLGS